MTKSSETGVFVGDKLQAALPDLIGASAVQADLDGSIRLVGSLCRDCSLRMAPPAPVCPGCGSEAVEREVQPEEGVLYSMTTLHVGPSKWAKPMMLGYVDLTNGVRVFAPLQGNGHAIGAPVRVATGVVGAAADGTPLYNFVFVPKESRP